MKAANTHKVKKKNLKLNFFFFFLPVWWLRKLTKEKKKKFLISFSQSRLQNKNQLYQSIYLYQAT